MKIYPPLLIIFILILCFGFFIISSLSQGAENITNGFTRISDDIKGENWLKAEEEFNSVKREWIQYRKWLPMIIDHHGIENIDVSLSRLGEYLNYQNPALAAGELSELKQLLNRIPENEKVSWENIF